MPATLKSPAEPAGGAEAAESAVAGPSETADRVYRLIREGIINATLICFLPAEAGARRPPGAVERSGT